MNEKTRSGERLELMFVAALRSIAPRNPFLLAAFHSSPVPRLTQNLIAFDHKFVEERWNEVVGFVVLWQRTTIFLRVSGRIIHPVHFGD
jgi:hypothetical protein